MIAIIYKYDFCQFLHKMKGICLKNDKIMAVYPDKMNKITALPLL